jgi:hypothetical protein
MTNKASSFPGAPAIGPLHRHGGKITALAELPIHALGDDYLVEGNGTVQRLPPLNPGITVFLRIIGTPTFANSTKLLCPSGIDYAASSGDLIIARSDGDDVWRLYPIARKFISTIDSQSGAWTTDGTSTNSSGNVLQARRKNYLKNPGFRIAQRYGTTGPIVDGTANQNLPIIDRWRVAANGAGKIGLLRSRRPVGRQEGHLIVYSAW